MRKVLLTLMIAVPSIAFSQLGVAVHQSNLPFVGINYEVKPRLRPEVRVSVDNYFSSLSVEGIITYDVLKTEDYEFYAGLGARSGDFTGLVIPVGLNIYPLPAKQFGFHIEVAPIIGDDLLRASWGIRYRFNKKSNK